MELTASSEHAGLNRPHSRPFALAGRLRRSRSLASLLPALLLTGVITLATAAVSTLLNPGAASGFVAHWMQSWLTAWPIAFPIAWMLAPLLDRLSVGMGAPAARTGLNVGSITSASDKASAKHGLAPRRQLRDSRRII